jgi:hypothetical protein
MENLSLPMMQLTSQRKHTNLVDLISLAIASTRPCYPAVPKTAEKLTFKAPAVRATASWSQVVPSHSLLPSAPGGFPSGPGGSCGLPSGLAALGAFP